MAENTAGREKFSLDFRSTYVLLTTGSHPLKPWDNSNEGNKRVWFISGGQYVRNCSGEITQKVASSGRTKEKLRGEFKAEEISSMSFSLMSQTAFNSLQNKRQPFPIVNFALSWHQLRDLQYLWFIIAFHSHSSDLFFVLLKSRFAFVTALCYELPADKTPADSGDGEEEVSLASKLSVKASQKFNDKVGHGDSPYEWCRLNVSVWCRTASDRANTTFARDRDPFEWPGTGSRPWAPWRDRHLGTLPMCAVAWTHLANQWSVEKENNEISLAKGRSRRVVPSGRHVWGCLRVRQATLSSLPSWIYPSICEWKRALGFKAYGAWKDFESKIDLAARVRLKETRATSFQPWRLLFPANLATATKVVSRNWRLPLNLTLSERNLRLITQGTRKPPSPE